MFQPAGSSARLSAPRTAAALDLEGAMVRLFEERDPPALEEEISDEAGDEAADMRPEGDARLARVGVASR